MNLDKNFKIIVYSPRLNGGGAERVVVELCNYFVNHQIDIALVLGKKDGPMIEFLDEKISVIDLNCKRMRNTFFPLLKYVRKTRPNVLLTGLMIPNIMAAIIGLFCKRIKIYITVHSDFTVERLPFWILFLSKIFYSCTNGVIAVSDGVKDWVETNFKHVTVHRIYNPIVNENIINMSKDKPIHNYPNSMERKLKVLSVAGLRPPKDFYCLIDAISIISSQKDVHLLIAGDGPDRADIEKYIIEKNACSFITLLGYVKNPYAYMAQADVFVLSSRWEGLPNVIIEALAVGTQIVASDCKSGPREILADGRYGRLVSVGDSKEMAKAIIDAVLHPIGSNLLIQRASEFSVQTNAEEYISFLNIKRRI